MILDQYDYRLIQLFKSCKPYTENDVKQIWAERCGTGVEFAQLEFINHHLTLLAYNLNLFSNEDIFTDFIYSLSPKQNWCYVTEKSLLRIHTQDFNIILLSRLASLFSLTKVKDLPGYYEYAINVKNVKF